MTLMIWLAKPAAEVVLRALLTLYPSAMALMSTWRVSRVYVQAALPLSNVN